MGSQQLLTIAVGILIIALMIYAAVGIVEKHLENSNRNQLIASLRNLGIMVQQYNKKSVEMGGGGGSYSGWTIPSEFKQLDAGKINANIQVSKVSFYAIGKELGMNSKDKIRVTCRVDKNGIRMVVIN